MIDKDYQIMAIDELTRYIIDCIEDIEDIGGERLKLLFSACCRAGKTRVFSKALRNAQREKGNIVVIAVTVGSMPQQLYNDINDVYSEIGATDMNTIFKSDALDQGVLNPGDWLVLGWPEFNKHNSRFMQLDENWNNLETICKRTRDSGYIIIQLIDEAHLTAQTDRSIERINKIINPHIIVEVTATVIPGMKGYYQSCLIPYRKVAKAGLVKKEIIINPGLEDIFDKQTVVKSDGARLNESIEYRRKIEKIYKNNGIKCVPLLVVVCKNGNEEKLEWTKSFCEKYEGVKSVAMFLSGQKETLDGEKITIEDLKDNDAIKIVIVKQALATGWNCPRAEVMVLLRSLIPGSAFSVQVISRILSTFGAKHYDNNILDRSAVFSNIEGLRELIDDSLIFNNIPIVDEADVEVRSEFKDLIWNLRNSYILRDEKKNRISGFWSIFKNEVEKYEWQDKVDKNKTEVHHFVEGSYIISSEKILDPSINKKISDVGGNRERKITDDIDDIEIEFNKWCVEQVQEWAIKSAVKEIKNSLYRFGIEMLDIPFYTDKIQSVVMNDENRPYFEKIIKLAIEQYISIVRDNELIIDRSGEPVREIIMLKGKRKIRETYKIMPLWDPIPVRNFKISTLLTRKYTKCYYNKCKEAKNNLERLFIEEYIEKNDNILTWLKQPSSKSRSFFGIIYEYKGILYTFYPDFIIMLKNGDIVIIDTKAGQMKMEEHKACALQTWIKKENEWRKEEGLNGRIIGGIADFERKTQKWKIYDEEDIEKYQHNNKTNDLSNFKELDDFINKERCYSF